MTTDRKHYPKQRTSPRKAGMQALTIISVMMVFTFVTSFIAQGGNESPVKSSSGEITVPIQHEESRSPEPSTVPVATEEPKAQEPATSELSRAEPANSEDYSVQAVLSAKRRVVISSTIDGNIRKFNFENGDIFKK